MNFIFRNKIFIESKVHVVNLTTISVVEHKHYFIMLIKYNIHMIKYHDDETNMMIDILKKYTINNNNYI